MQSLQVGPSNIQSSSVVRNLGVYLDWEPTMKQHIAKTASTCFYHIRRLCQVRRPVGQEVTQQLQVLAFITSRLDYCNSLLAGLPRSTPHWSHFNEFRMQLLGLGRSEPHPAALAVIVIYRVKFKL